MTTGTFTITPDSSTTQFTEPVGTGYTKAIAGIATPLNPARFPCHVFNASVSGDTLTVSAACSDGSPIPAEWGDIDITYILD